MKLYLGSKDYKPDGFLTVDIDADMKPDIVADITKMEVIESGSADEVVAGHVLEHIEWPDSFLAFAEFARVLKIGGVVRIAVPDLASLVRMMLAGDSAFHVVGLIYGVGGRVNSFEQHRYGFTPGMIVDILESLGFAQFDWWNSDFGDACNGWVPRYEGDHFGISLNVKAIKTSDRSLDAPAVYERLKERPLSDYSAVLAEVVEAIVPKSPGGLTVPKLYQRIHYQLIDARQRIAYLENEIAKISS